MSADARAALDELVVEAVKLRFDVGLSGAAPTPAQLLDSLYDIRGRLDRVEEILTQALRLRARVRAAATSAEALAEEAWDRAAQRGRQQPIARDDYSSGRERTAEANLATLDQRRAARTAAELAAYVDAQVDTLRTLHRGLDGVRHDLLAVIRALAFESHLER